MDIQMPHVDGIEATQAIRRLPGHTAIPIIAMTANAFNEDRDICLGAGMNDHLAKPVAPAKLYATLLRWIRTEVPRLAGSPSTPPVLDEGTLHMLHGITGLDVAGGLKVVSGKLPLYLRVLKMFASTHQGDATKLFDALDSGRLDDARNIAHALKGSAANIGARKIQEIAAGIELPLKQNLSNASSLAHNLLVDLGLELDRFIEQLAALQDDSAGKPADQSSGTADAEVLLARLRELLGTDDMASQRYFAANRAEFDGALGSERARQIAGLIDECNFELAQAALTAGLPTQATSCSRT
jgi:CheY-like chemotaxis protein